MQIYLRFFGIQDGSLKVWESRSLKVFDEGVERRKLEVFFEFTEIRKNLYYQHHSIGLCELCCYKFQLLKIITHSLSNLLTSQLNNFETF